MIPRNVLLIVTLTAYPASFADNDKTLHCRSSSGRYALVVDTSAGNAQIYVSGRPIENGFLQCRQSLCTSGPGARTAFSAEQRKEKGGMRLFKLYEERFGEAPSLVSRLDCEG